MTYTITGAVTLTKEESNYVQKAKIIVCFTGNKTKSKFLLIKLVI